MQKKSSLFLFFSFVIFTCFKLSAQCAGPLPTITVTGPSSVCAGEHATITASGATSYTWAVGPNSASIVVSPLSTMVYTVSGSAAPGCTASVEYTLTVHAVPVLSVGVSPLIVLALPPFGPDEGVVCFGETSTLTASGADTYSWNTGPTSQSIAITVTTNATTYTVTGTNVFGCANITSFTAISVSPHINLSPLRYICAGNSLTLDVYGTLINLDYLWSTGSTLPYTVVTPTATTSYTVSSVNHCITSAVCNVIVVPGPTITLTASRNTICSGESSILTASGADTYTWNNGAGSSSISVTPATTTTYTLAGTGGPTGACTNTVTIEALVDPCTGLKDNPDTDDLVTVFPNPAGAAIFIESPVGIRSFTIKDLSGRTVMAQQPGYLPKQLHLDIENLNAGVYFMEINQGKPLKIIKN